MAQSTADDTEKIEKYDAATEALQEAAEATEDDELSARLVEARTEVGNVALEEVGVSEFLVRE